MGRKKPAHSKKNGRKKKGRLMGGIKKCPLEKKGQVFKKKWAHDGHIGHKKLRN